MSFSGISTILPVYFDAAEPESIRLLVRAANSVLDQQCALPLELIVVDDGCPHPLRDLPDVKALFSRPEVSSIRLPRNQGLVFALNAGLSRARHDLIARIDVDDRWLPAKLEKQFEAFAADPDLTLLGTGMRIVSRDGVPIEEHIRGPGWIEALQFLKTTGCPFPHGSILARKDVFALLAGYPHALAVRHCEDFALWAVWIRFFKCGLLPDVLFEYTVSDSQVSARHVNDQIEAAGLLQQRFRQLPDPALIPAAMAKIARALRRPLLETGKILYLAWRHYDSILVDPELRQSAGILLPDREVCCFEDASRLSGDRFFYLHESLHEGESFDRGPVAHARCLHSIATLRRLLA
jgi:glycosyltransferase involved in cell wall biosynthesis